MPRTTRTTQSFDFLELSDNLFEDLVRRLAVTSGVDWDRAPEPVGQLGADRGRDDRGWERVLTRGRRRVAEREWRYQAKRWKEFGPADARKVVR